MARRYAAVPNRAAASPAQPAASAALTRGQTSVSLFFVTDPMGSAHNRVTDILRTVLGSVWQWAGAFFLLRGAIAARRPEWERLVAFIASGRRHRYYGTGRSKPWIENRRPTDLSESRFVIEGPKHLHSVSNPGAIVWDRYSRNGLRLRWLSKSRIGPGRIECLVHPAAASLN